MRLHPDKGGDKQQFQQLQESYARVLEERQARRPAAATASTGRLPAHRAEEEAAEATEAWS